MAYDHHLRRGFQFGVPQDKQVDGRIQRYEINYSLGSGYLEEELTDLLINYIWEMDNSFAQLIHLL